MTAKEGVAWARGLEPSLGTWGERLLLPSPALQAIKNFFHSAYREVMTSIN